MYEFKVSNIIRQPNNNISIQFEDLSGAYPIYKSGQFLTLSFLFDNREVRRSYSFSSSPYANEPIEITVKRVENGEISRLLHHKLKVNDVINVLEPQGLFVYEPQVVKSTNTIFLFAAGVGITPLFSILKTVLLTDNTTKVVLVYSNNSKENTLFYDELLSWKAKYSERLFIEFIWSNSKNLMKARLNRDYLISIVKSNLLTDINEFYTCGPLFYMDLVRFTLLGMGILDEHIHKETFHFPEEEDDDDEHEEEEVDSKVYNVLLNYNGSAYSLKVHGYETILEVGLKHNLKLPYSCKSGMCSTCISQVKHGSVKMDYNEVLTDNEVLNGKCLLCVSHPVEDNLVIDVD